MIRVTGILSLALTGILGFAAPGLALPMTPEECTRARSEQSDLESSGVVNDMARGPDWARDNLAPERLQRVARWIELQEQVLFRCPRPKPPPASETAREGEPGTQAKPAKSAGKPKPAKDAKAAAAAPSSEAGSSPEASAKPAKTKTRKPKVDDAYRPPVPLSGEELQHAAPGP